MSKPLREAVPFTAAEVPGWVVEDLNPGAGLVVKRERGTDLYLDKLLAWLAKERPDWYLRLVGRRQISEAEAALASDALKASAEQSATDRANKERFLDEIYRESRYDYGRP